VKSPPQAAPPSDPPANLYGLGRDALASALLPWTDRRFHADQLYHWMYGRQATSFEAMSDLSGALRRALPSRHRISWPEAQVAGRSADGSVKYVLRLEDGREIEAVHIVYGRRITFCISSQVGCGLACGFCLTGTMGLVRNLTPGEILGQVSALAHAGSVDLASVRIVFMGMGEPLHNYDSVLEAFRILVDPRGFGVNTRRVTLSTVGLVPGIERLAGEDPRPRLAVSLSASTDPVRDRLVPINRKHDLEALLGVCRRFPLAPRERITFEYILLQGINDGTADADRVARLLHGVRAKVNVIPYNETGLAGFRTPASPVAVRFRDTLLARGIPATIRWSKGRDIGAACGQLARGGGDAARG